VDDVADGELPVEEKREKLHELGAALDAPPANAMFVALADARSRFAIPDKPLHDLVAGGLQDTEQDRYADFAELHGYCRRVRGRSASPASRCTAPRTSSAPRPSAWPCS
jgi:phytoene synthase